jgi:DNA polymerase delta subunit 1
MNILRGLNHVAISPKEDVIFQVIDWSILDVAKEEDNGSDSEDDGGNFKMIKKECTIRMFGVTEDLNSIMVQVEGFTPFFYVEIPTNWKKDHVDKFVKSVKGRAPPYIRHSLINYDVVYKCHFYGFRNGKKFPFLRLVFSNLSGFYAFRKLLSNKIRISLLNMERRFNLFESNLDPILKFMHTRNIKSSGWIKVKGGKFKINNGLKAISNCQLDIITKWTNIFAHDRDDINFITVASFDIEANSVHRTKFPQANPSEEYIENLRDELKNKWKDVIESYVNNCAIYEKDFPITKYINSIEEEIGDSLEKTGKFPNTFKTDKKYKIPNNLKVKKKQIPLDVFINNLKEKLKDEVDNRVIVPEDYNGDEVIQIGTTISVCGKGKEIVYQHLVALRSCNKIDGVEVESYETESEVLIAWTNFIRRLDPDIITGYNIFGFDFKFMYNRAEVLGCLDEFSQLGRIKGEKCPLKELVLQSSALGFNQMYHVPMTGRVVIDLYKIVQRDYKLTSYKLDFVATKFIGQQKNDIKPWQIFKLFKGDAEDRKVLGEYCVQDCVLCNVLLDKLMILINNISMANVCSVPLSYIFFRGQGIKIFSLVAKQCYNEGYVIPVIEKNPDFKTVRGAIVFEPQKGYYTKPVFVCDFNSLYPSCIISENLSHDCLVKKGGKYDDIEGVDYKDIEFEYLDGTMETARFAQLPKKGIIPRILMVLLAERKKVKKQMKGEQDTFKKSILNGRQLALKVTANSLYGQTGANTSKIRCVPIAGCTTATGRRLLTFSRDYVEEHYKHLGAKCIYGDSVSKNTPITVKMNKEIRVLPIEKLGNDYAKYGAKEEDDTVKCEVWTDKGWTNVRRVIRHKTKKKMYRVMTRHGIVDVTEDHSLVNDKLAKIKAEDCVIGETKLLHSSPKI